jgi:hypothetical protein
MALVPEAYRNHPDLMKEYPEVGGCGCWWWWCLGHQAAPGLTRPPCSCASCACTSAACRLLTPSTPHPLLRRRRWWTSTSSSRGCRRGGMARRCWCSATASASARGWTATACAPRASGAPATTSSTWPQRWACWGTSSPTPATSWPRAGWAPGRWCSQVSSASVSARPHTPAHADARLGAGDRGQPGGGDCSISHHASFAARSQCILRCANGQAWPAGPGGCLCSPLHWPRLVRPLLPSPHTPHPTPHTPHSTDLEDGSFRENAAISKAVATKRPYKQWVKSAVRKLDTMGVSSFVQEPVMDAGHMLRLQAANGARPGWGPARCRQRAGCLPAPLPSPAPARSMYRHAPAAAGPPAAMPQAQAQFQHSLRPRPPSIPHPPTPLGPAQAWALRTRR